MAAKEESNVKISRLCGIQGHNDKTNDIVVCKGQATCTDKRHVIYFGGDLQDFKENMSLYNPEYAAWDLETVARTLQSRFPGSTVFVVRPSEMLLNTFSIYRNFLSFDEDGRPEFSSDFGALIHLAHLYKNALKSVQQSDMESSPSDAAQPCVADVGENIPVTLIGFSKGCVVINQLMFELSGLKENTDVAEFLSTLEAVYWLDGGHIGRKDAYITDYEVLQNIVNLGVQLVVHVTPYQIMDTNRPWIGIEEREFVQRLKRAGANIQEYKHFMNFKPSIKYHFKVLTQL